MSKDIAAFTTAVLMILFAGRYVYQIWKRQITPALATWITFLLGTGFSLITYLVAEDRGFVSGILNAMDVAVVISIITTILVCGNKEVKISGFEKMYFVGIAMILIYAIITQNSSISNMLIQALMVLGYIPTLHAMWSSKSKTESYSAWGLNLLAGLTALYPATTRGGNLLAALYAGRTVVCTIIIMAAMVYYQIKEKKK